MIDEKKLIEDLKRLFSNYELDLPNTDSLEILNRTIEALEQQKTDWIPCEDVLSMSESDFITHILSTICDYAKVNNYEITETVKAMGENLIALTEIANFDKWKEGVTDDE